MNDLALIAIGCGFGLSLALVSVLACFLAWSTYKQRELTQTAQKNLARLLESNMQSVDRLRGEVTLALSRMDAERLYAASLQIQRASRSLGQQVDTLQRALFASQHGPAISTGPDPAFSLDEEALDDERLVAERARWQGAHQPQPGPLDGLSDEEKAARVQQFFQRRRGEQAGGTGGIYSPASTPPAAGSGIYASLLEEVQATQPFVPRAAPADFDDAGTGDGVDLTEKGELG